MNCKKCKFEEMFFCKRYPPVAIANPEILKGFFLVYPEIVDGDWCGEFKKKVGEVKSCDNCFYRTNILVHSKCHSCGVGYNYPHWKAAVTIIIKEDGRKIDTINLTKTEIQNGSTRQQWAEGLIVQLPITHDGRNSWLLNYGIKAEAEKIRKNHKVPVGFDYHFMAVHTVGPNIFDGNKFFCDTAKAQLDLYERQVDIYRKRVEDYSKKIKLTPSMKEEVKKFNDTVNEFNSFGESINFKPVMLVIDDPIKNCSTCPKGKLTSVPADDCLDGDCHLLEEGMKIINETMRSLLDSMEFCSKPGGFKSMGKKLSVMKS